MTRVQKLFRWHLACCLILTICGISSPVFGQKDLTPEHEKFFETKIRPVLVKHCYECHSIDSGKTRGGLLVDTRDGLVLGGESGPAIESNLLDESTLWSAINYDDYNMPPAGKLPAQTIEDFKKWIQMGAPDPRIREKIVVESKVDIESAKEHWAFQKPKSSTDEVDIDSLVKRKLIAAGLTPQDPADPATLLRRLYFDLNGLPPTPEDTRAFAKAYKDDAASAVKLTVDQLLASEQYGERWGRHWLDLARFAESSGNTNMTYPHAWRYRNYVIDSFNDDTPYDRFIAEQLAGDLLPVKTDEQWQENLIATGFLAVGIKSLSERNPRKFEMDVADEQIDTMSQAFLGLTVSCARCHDHKFDAIPTTDYYSMAGIFLSTETFYGTVSAIQNRQATDLLLLPIEDKNATTRALTKDGVQGIKDRIASVEAEIRQIRIASRRPGGEKPEQRKMVAMRNQIGLMKGVLKSVDANGVPKTYAMGVQDAKQPKDVNVLLRGDVEKRAQIVERGFLQVLSHVPANEIKSNSSGRKELAQWIGSPENPLTARVMVNRIWMHMTGKALMDSPNNWGSAAQTPANQELLDYLAVRFVENGWSVKSVVREIANSETYQRSSSFDQASDSIDPENKWMWRANPRQIDAESLRDSMLAISSTLDLKRPFGSQVATVGDAAVGRSIDKNTFNTVNPHRSVYLPVIRDAIPESLALFDFADPNASNAQRDSTNVASQALYLINNEIVMYQSQKMAVELTKRFDTNRERIKSAFELAYGRPATLEEYQASARFFRTFKPPAVATSKNAANGSSRRSRRAGRSLQGGMNQGMQGQMENAARSRLGLPEKTIPKLNLTREQQTLAYFCQSLMASAEFRILN